jgi:lysozyme
MLHGVDISAYQSSIPSGQDFVILKATEGTSYVDGNFAGWWSELAGKLRGAYHFAHPGNNATTEADHFVSEVGSRLKPGDLVVLDFETNDGTSAVHCASWAKTWLQRVHSKTGRNPVLYTFLSFAWDGNCAGLGGYPLWIADPSSAAGKPRVPSPWKNWTLHQYSTSGGIDHDVFNGTAAQWRTLGGLPPTPVPPQEDDDMPYGQLSEGKDAITPIALPKGKYKSLGFTCDNGLQDLPSATIRVALHSAAGGWDQIVASQVIDSSKGQTVIAFKSTDVDGVSVQRLDDGDVHIAYEIS